MSVIISHSCDMIPMGKNNNNKQDGNDWYKKKDKSNHDLPKRKTSARLGPFLLLKTLGVGEFGKVKMGKHVETDQKVRKREQDGGW